MSAFTILAQMAEPYYYDQPATAAPATGPVSQTLAFFWDQIAALGWLHAVLAISFGVIYLMYGWRIFKALTVISFALLGLYGGMWIGGRFDKALLGALLGIGVLAVLSIPMMRWAVGILGAVAGGIIAAGIWYACPLP
jgi:hypothetical protein